MSSLQNILSLRIIGIGMTGFKMVQFVYVMSIVLHEAKTAGTFCLQLNTTG